MDCSEVRPSVSSAECACVREAVPSTPTNHQQIVTMRQPPVKHALCNALLLAAAATTSLVVEGFQIHPTSCRPAGATAALIDRPYLSTPSSLSSSSSSSGEVGQGSNWIEKSFPVETEEKIDIKKVEDYNLGISGKDFQTGSLSQRMFDAIISRTSLDMSEEIRQAFVLYAMDFTAKEAARAALQQNGLQMVLQEEEGDQGMWGDVEAVRLYDNETGGLPSQSIVYDSLEEAVEDGGWTPGQTFDFVARQVPAKIKELSIEELVQALDPDGTLREESKRLKGEDAADPDEEALLSIFDDAIMTSLADLANDNVQRTESAPREATTEESAFAGTESSGYRIVSRSDLLRDSINQDGTENEKSEYHHSVQLGMYVSFLYDCLQAHLATTYCSPGSCDAFTCGSWSLAR